MTRLLLIPILSVSLAACASPGARRPAAVNPRETTKTREYEVLRQKIADLHSALLISGDAPVLFDMKTLDSDAARIEHEYCASGMPSAKCAREINQAVFSELSQRYFAADPREVKQTCMSEPLICDDLNTLETLYRHLHNASVERSEREKLGLIDEWHRGELSEDQLKAALHVDFKFENGKIHLEPLG